MKKFLAITLSIIMVFSLCACGGNKESKIDCSNCGESISEGVSFCEHCGAKITNTDNENSTNSTTDNNPSESSQPTSLPTTSQTDSTTQSDTDTSQNQNNVVNNTPSNDDIPNDPKPTITANKSKLQLNNVSDVVYITISGDYTIEYDIGDTDIVNCEWGDWDGYTIPLTFNPVSSGQTSVTISIEGYNAAVTINVSVTMPESTLTIVGVGQEYHTYYSAPNEAVCFLHSAEYRKTEHYNDDKVYFEIDVVAELLSVNYYGGDYFRIRYELYDENGVCVQTSDIMFDARYLNKKYSQMFNFFGKAGNYTLKFTDAYV